MDMDFRDTLDETYDCAYSIHTHTHTHQVFKIFASKERLIFGNYLHCISFICQFLITLFI